MDHLYFLSLVFVMLSRLFISALWSPERADLLALVVMFIVILLLSHLVFWNRCGT